MGTRNFLLLLAMACIFGPGAGTARIRSSSDAPWKPGRVLAYWVQSTDELQVDEGGDDSGWYYEDYSRISGTGTLFLVDSEKLDCDTLLSESWLEDGAEKIGNGLIIAVSYYDSAYGDEALEQDLGFEGLYLGGESSKIDTGADREMYIYAIYDGYMSPLSFYYFSLDPTWVRIDSVDKDAVKGEFYTETWEGDFNALNCGTLEEPYWADTGYYDY